MAKAVRLNNGKGKEEVEAAKPAASTKEKKAKSAAVEPGGQAVTKSKKSVASVVPAKKVTKILITQPRPDTDKSPYFELGAPL